MVSMHVVRNLAGAVTEAGGSQAAFLRAAKLEPAELQSSCQKVPRTKLHDLCALAVDLTEDAALGLHSIERLPADAMNPIASLVVHAATLREALDAIVEFRRLYGDEPSFRVCNDRETVLVVHELVPDERVQVQRYMAEVTLAGLFRLIRRFKAAAHVNYASFQYAPPEYVAEYQRIFEGRVRFNQTFTGLSFESVLLDAPAPFPDQELHHALCSLARRRVSEQTSVASCEARIHDYLVWQSRPRDMSMQSAARALGMSIRTLRRQLGAEGKSYADIVENARA